MKYFWAYLLIGFVVGLICDWFNMRREIPYAEWPAQPLWTLRVGTVLPVMVVWPMVIYWAVEALAARLRIFFHILRRARRIYGHRR